LGELDGEYDLWADELLRGIMRDERSLVGMDGRGMPPDHGSYSPEGVILGEMGG